LIERAEVMRIAKLARLELNEDEIAQYQEDLTRFLESGAKLRQVDVSEVEGTSHVIEIRHPLRKDEVRESLSQAAATAGGPHVVNGYFRVPQILEGQE